MQESRVRVVFMGTPEFSVPSLEGLVHDGYEIAAVYTQPDRPAGRSREVVLSPVKKAALEHGIPVYQPARLRDPEEMQSLAGLEPEVIVVAAFGQILPRSVLDIPRYGCLNVHPSLLPRYRGATPVPAAILNGDRETGVTIMLMDAGLDTGPVLSQIVVDILPDDTTGTLSERLAQAGARLLTETLPLWIDGSLKPNAQDDSKATVTASIKKEDGEIDWSMPAGVISRRVRAFEPWPGSYTHWQGKVVKIIEAVSLPDIGDGEAGKVFQLGPGMPALVGVRTGEGILGLLTVQLEGKRPLPADEFMRGQRSFVGSLLGR
ncbi:MAG: methionyl-tRNA formyltransferase [Dehalococcoidia bacterium]|nr:methionyl-tRNA formyltransferase [Dehalococcoidia bacterium]